MKQMRYKFKKRFFIIIVLFAAVICLAAFFLMRDSKTEAVKTVSTTTNNEIFNTKYIDGIQEMPNSYTNEAKKQGTIATIKYNSEMIDGSGRIIEKTARVYLPYGYDGKNHYNTFYLMHGYGGTYRTFLGSKLSPRPFKNVLDNMIEKGDIEPLIVVTPGYTEEYTDYYQQLDGMSDELILDLIPAVEGKYSSYAKTVSEEDLIASRQHRAVGGFSMGGCATWYTLMNHPQYFQYYLPTSMPIYYNDNGYIEQESIWGAQRIHDGIVNAGYEKKKLYVFSASGDKDFMSKGTKMQGQDLCQYDEFTYTDKSFKDGNLTFYSWKGHRHSYKESFPYFYNGLIRFYKI